jgi:hypothetical protein
MSPADILRGFLFGDSIGSWSEGFFDAGGQYCHYSFFKGNYLIYKQGRPVGVGEVTTQDSVNLSGRLLFIIPANRLFSFFGGIILA